MHVATSFRGKFYRKVTGGLLSLIIIVPTYVGLRSLQGVNFYLFLLVLIVVISGDMYSVVYIKLCPCFK